MPQKRDPKTGRYVANGGAYLDEKGYPRISCGPCRGQRIHRVKAAIKLGRELSKDEDVHHLNADKAVFSDRNLHIMGHKEHGCVSAKQHWYVKEHDIHLKNEWDEFFEAESVQ